MNKSIKKFNAPKIKAPWSTGQKSAVAVSVLVLVALMTSAALYFFVIRPTMLGPVTLYSECNYRGSAKQLPRPGMYKSPIAISSLVVPQGYKVTLMEEKTGNGRKLLLAGGTYPCLNLNFIDFRGRPRYVKIELDNE